MNQFAEQEIDEFSAAVNFKGSILGYDQESCLRYGLDVTDLMFFGWLEKFASNGKMAHREFGGQIFYNLHLDGFFRSLPICHVNKEAMKKRIAQYIQKGLLEKRTVQTQNGRALFVRFLEPYWHLQFDKDGEERGKSRKGITVPVENPPQRYGDTRAQRYGDTRAQRYGDTRALNNPTVHDPTVHNPPPENKKREVDPASKKMELAITDTVCRLFDATRFQTLMPERFAGDLTAALEEGGIESVPEAEEYLGWMFESCRSKKPDNLKKYFYVAATKSYNIADFVRRKAELRKQREDREKSRLIKCPVCMTAHDIRAPCPECGLENAFIPDDAIREKRLLRRLPAGEREKLESELDAIGRSCTDTGGIASVAELASIRMRKQEILGRYEKGIPGTKGGFT